MSAAVREAHATDEPAGTEEPRLRRWNVHEYHRMADVGLLGPNDRVELIDGEILLKWTAGPLRRRWTCEEYEKMGDVGLLTPEDRVELIDGDVLEMSPQRARHAATVMLVAEALRRIFFDGFHVRTQLPLRLRGGSEPEPDAAVVIGMPEDYLEAHPTETVLLVEVSDTTLRFDRTTKAALYAAAGILDYWIIDLVNDRLEVRREPATRAGKPYWHGYDRSDKYGRGQAVTPLALPDVMLAVDELLPKRKKDEKR